MFIGSEMSIRLIIFFVFLCLNINYNWQNQNNIPSIKNKINVYGVFNGREYEEILFNNKTDIVIYEKPSFSNGNPNLFKQTMSLVSKNNNIEFSIKNIKYIPPTIEKIPKKMPIVLIYNKQQWHEIQITFSNNEVKNYLLPASTQITMIDSILRLHSTIDIARLIDDGLFIIGVKEKKEFIIKEKEFIVKEVIK